MDRASSVVSAQHVESFFPELPWWGDLAIGVPVLLLGVIALASLAHQRVSTWHGLRRFLCVQFPWLSRSTAQAVVSFIRWVRTLGWVCVVGGGYLLVRGVDWFFPPDPTPDDMSSGGGPAWWPLFSAGVILCTLALRARFRRTWRGEALRRWWYPGAWGFPLPEVIMLPCILFLGLLMTIMGIGHFLDWIARLLV